MVGRADKWLGTMRCFNSVVPAFIYAGNRSENFSANSGILAIASSF